MKLLGDAGVHNLLASRGAVPVIMETSETRCTRCGEKLPKGSRAVFAWDDKRHAQPSRLHVEGEGKVEVRHESCQR